MSGIKKQYFYSLIFLDIIRVEVEEEVRDFYLPITKNSMEKHQQYFPSLANVMEPYVNSFKSNDGRSCMATLYGYERRIEDPVDEQDEEGQNLWLTILDLLLGFVGTMRKSHELLFKVNFIFFNDWWSNRVNYFGFEKVRFTGHKERILEFGKDIKMFKLKVANQIRRKKAFENFFSYLRFSHKK